MKVIQFRVKSYNNRRRTDEEPGSKNDPEVSAKNFG